MKIERKEEDIQFDSLSLVEVNFLIETLDLTNFSLIVLKPGFSGKVSERLGFSFDQILQGLIDSSQLNTISSTKKELSEIEVKVLYNSIFSRKPIHQGATSFRNDLLEYMQSSEVHIFLVQGRDAQKKAELIKQAYRNIVGLEPGTSKVRNILHVPDTDELIETIGALFE